MAPFGNSTFGLRPAFGRRPSDFGLSPSSAPSSDAAGAGSPSARFLVLGLGNDILSDDAIGLRVVREVRRELAADRSIDVCETTEMGLALLDFMSGYPTVIIVDSIQTGKAEPGVVHEVDAAALKQLTGRTPHFVGVSETLALGNRLGLPMPKQVKIFAVEVADPFTVGTDLTAGLQSALPQIVQHIVASVRALKESAGSGSPARCEWRAD